MIFLMSLFMSVLTWNWNETLSMDMEKVIVEIAGQSTWDAMTFNI